MKSNVDFKPKFSNTIFSISFSFFFCTMDMIHVVISYSLSSAPKTWNYWATWYYIDGQSLLTWLLEAVLKATWWRWSDQVHITFLEKCMAHRKQQINKILHFKTITTTISTAALQLQGGTRIKKGKKKKKKAVDSLFFPKTPIWLTWAAKYESPG